MVRPTSIVNFERCYLGALALSFVTFAATWSAQRALLERNPATAPLGAGAVMGTAIAILLVSAIINLLLWYFTARRGSVVAKWIIVVFFGLGALVLLRSLTNGMFMAGFGGVLQVAVFVLQAVSVYLLFRPDANAWFGDRNRAADVGDTFR